MNVKKHTEHSNTLSSLVFVIWTPLNQVFTLPMLRHGKDCHGLRCRRGRWSSKLAIIPMHILQGYSKAWHSPEPWSCYLTSEVPLLDVSALPVLISTVNHVPLQQTRKSYITTSRVRTSFVTEINRFFLHILNLFISFDHLIPGKSN